MQVSAVAARRYARALLEVAQEQGDPAQVRDELVGLAALLERNRQLADSLAHPALGPDRRRALAAAILEGAGAQALTRRLVELLAERGRIGLLSAVAEAFIALWNAHRGVVVAEAASAVALEAEERQALAAALAKLTGRQVELETRQDPSLLGGVVVQIEGWVYDGSVVARLAALRRRLVSGAAPA